MTTLLTTRDLRLTYKLGKTFFVVGGAEHLLLKDAESLRRQGVDYRLEEFDGCVWRDVEESEAQHA